VFAARPAFGQLASDNPAGILAEQRISASAWFCG